MLTDLQRRALEAFDCIEDGYSLSFAAIASNTDVPSFLIRRIVRALARKGLLEYRRLAWDDCGWPAGAGYFCTPAGRQALKEGK